MQNKHISLRHLRSSCLICPGFHTPRIPYSFLQVVAIELLNAEHFRKIPGFLMTKVIDVIGKTQESCLVKVPYLISLVCSRFLCYSVVLVAQSLSLRWVPVKRGILGLDSPTYLLNYLGSNT